ncbi:glutathione synthetase [Bacillus sp. AFS076308]|uniref:YheC/YheD family endospore coat-associated protein n=1 Tax=unclassified Bacillus (in: firmicutes) TaxID=185979 RepID=UPI000BF2D0CC|nr:MULTISPECIES: YheC/YheD family protein [unclassified Bacillus (in: firmicutes)]PFO04274.1 glutathione synthetase [Bacillus sp. AFS076308]PGV51913.1 glutathione synthetase [Bacillus sp. AFS037270]
MSFSLTSILVVPIKLSDKDQDVIQMSAQLFKLLQLNMHEINVSIGRRTIPIKVQTKDLTDNTIYFPEDLMESFYLPIHPLKFQAMVLPESQTLKLGPVAALLTDSIDNQNNEPYFRSIHLFCEELQQGISETGGFFYVFSYQQFLSQGYYLIDGKWTAAQLPAPDVIYNRIHSRALEYKKEFKQFRAKVNQLLIPFFNDRFLSKWEVYEHLKDIRNLDSYLPKTKLFSKDHFYEMTQKYGTLFLKPIHGSQGRNIIKVSREPDSCYSLETSLKSGPAKQRELFSLDEIFQQIKPLIHNRIYIIQQGISLMSYQLSSMDFRVLCHQNLDNNWRVTSTVARIAGKQEFVSNLARGGTLTRPLNALKTCLNDNKAVEVLAQMKELALETASIISQNSQGIIGELGIDIGVDQDGKPWLIEVNSKPSKNFEDGLTKIRPSAKAIIQFCTILAFDIAVMKEDI